MPGAPADSENGVAARVHSDCGGFAETGAPARGYTTRAARRAATSDAG